tara:strand:+ start:406 stop:636 length:231 start_codon:yes stop_codon:yes gene_type:complete
MGITTIGYAKSGQIIFISSSSARFLASFVQPAILTNNLPRAVSRKTPTKAGNPHVRLGVVMEVSWVWWLCVGFKVR